MGHRTWSGPRRAGRAGLAAGAAAALLLPTAVPASAAPGAAVPQLDGPSVVEVLLDGRDDLDRLVELGGDIARLDPADGGGFVAQTVIGPFDAEVYEEAGFTFGEVLYTESDAQDRIDEREEAIERLQAENGPADTPRALSSTDRLEVLRADYFEGRNGAFLSVEVRSDFGQAEDFRLTVERDAGPGTEFGDGGTQTLGRFVDVGVYMYHRGQAQVQERPDRIRVTGPHGGTAVAEVTEWLPDPRGPGDPLPYTDFLNAYMTPGELYDRIHQIAEEYPDIAEVIELPHRTNGYRRHAQAILGVSADGRNADRGVIVESLAYGHEGGNDLVVDLVDPAAPDSALSVAVDGDEITVSLANDGGGAVTTTAAEAVAAINAGAGDLVRAFTYRGDAGAGTVRAERVRADDFLSAPEDAVPREPAPVYALRIGATRDGSKTGVLGYAQEHAREWQTPLVTIETAERLVRNYGIHDTTTELVDELDIFLMPSFNPDGANYSFYDVPLHRKNMTNYCPTDGARDQWAVEQGAQWGVDNNRNYGAYTLWDGYSGASFSCTSGSFAGPRELGPLSQPENRNLVWLVDTHDNIDFSMNIHSSGDYFMWSPGAYIAEGRVPTPRPTAMQEAYFWESSADILGAIKEHRGTVVTPARTGPIIDVLYSAAGNSGDHLWYENGIFAWNFELGQAGFQPPWDEAHAQGMEYADGLYAMLGVALEYQRDRYRPRSSASPRAGAHTGPVEVAFDTNEPAEIYYTLDGSRPDYDSPRLNLTGVRGGLETLTLEETTTVHWFAVDIAGNVEGGYDPDGNARNHRRGTWTVTD
ncbi:MULTISPECIES: M14 family metallopeptidase [Nocardiopsis]|uniref:Chitobiase/beta-hexosaminidase C-terminal domain-containing protein n=1 Tax=Nocardiopsis changdeensis TaxID=2831969 RepID=A0ABX8BU96_9ACTN|nr:MULTISPECIES: M14 family metallopeptidase [Nocardiopsis]QUX24667.1 chitobiase/beta-hexosaminidase C-terminal domain-containing protein [Nocardiopsis changdeensis]QYX35055.1 chitobiase/beta-hexosaminidase C-terminal domain-containing protein [Nocardiopsis sp. MT53]